jgi:C-terminal processing protease CtpA/Prc
MELKSAVRILGCGVAALAVLGLAVLTTSQRETLSRLRAENRNLSQEFDRLRLETNDVERLRNQEAEIRQLRENTRDLLRLRDDARQLEEQRMENQLLQAANNQLLQLLQTTPLSSNQEAAVSAIRRQGAVLGVFLRPAAGDAQNSTPAPPRGVLVVGLDPNSPASRSDLKPGDVIVRLDGVPTDSSAQIQTLMLTRKPGETINLDILRGDALLHIPVQAGTWTR